MLRKIPFDDSAELLSRFAVSDEAAEVVVTQDPPEVTLGKLKESGSFVDVANFFAFGMPPREGVCWAIAVYRTMRPELDESESNVLALAERWVKDPQEGIRVRLMDMSEKIDNETALHWLCSAVAWNGSGSMGPPDGPVVLPPKGLHSSALLGAVSLLMDGTEEEFERLQDVAYQTGLEVAQGGWPTISQEGR
ncbi:hypothetical protein SLH49_17675 [Cognatiyoonia sp. IB215446]|uniref:DUF6931 family protein n=1 Tax=Cognatiyoonia sp. IB215446 TaxID=3097355 RepID=UPI002A0F26D7|nr:hypothetical protein [Cognatiyoonia sp. IB215446]MDX8349819.1 hypothetical protein [Cognatiyoonia sp. IB215446]